MKRLLRCLLGGGFLLGLLGARPAAAFEHPLSPQVLYGALFADVQRSGVFDDQKTFADCLPLGSPAAITGEYAALCAAAGRPAGTGLGDVAALRAFVAAHFTVPPPIPARPLPLADLRQHLDQLWAILQHPADGPQAGSSLLPLARPYIVPGGRFREIYYWDSYFTMLGLRASGRFALMEAMVANLADLAGRYGLIPNGNRTYYLSRSQPPVFALMLDLLAERDGSHVYVRYLPILRLEYAYWMDQGAPTHHVVRLADGRLLNRYWDQLDTPRDESFRQDEAVAAPPGRRRSELYRDLRSAAESGWDFSTRWLGDGRSLGTIRTTRLVPVDLNCLLEHLEVTLARGCLEAGRTEEAESFQQAAERRTAAILAHCWSDDLGFFVDYDLDAEQPANEPTLAGMMPLFLKLATRGQGGTAARLVERRLEGPGGVAATTQRSAQQWDAPNGWAPLEWLTVEGLRSYRQSGLADEIARRWLATNERVYRQTGRMMEKYDVMNPAAPAGGGEYPGQDGFGWTNGVYLALAALPP